MKAAGWLPALALPAALGLAWAALHAPAEVAPLVSAAPQVCQSGRLHSENTFRGRAVADHVEWSGDPGALPGGLNATFWSSGLLRLAVCRSGTLSFTVSGTAAQGQDAVLTVALGPARLLDTPARLPRVFHLRISGPGWLTFGFPNDLYRPPEDRNLFLRRVTFRPD